MFHETIFPFHNINILDSISLPISVQEDFCFDTHSPLTQNPSNHTPPTDCSPSTSEIQPSFNIPSSQYHMPLRRSDRNHTRPS